MSKTKKYNSPEEYLVDQIKQETNQETIFVSDHTCDHSLAIHGALKEDGDGWHFTRMYCPDCDSAWDAWTAPGAYQWKLVLNMSGDGIWPTDGTVGNNGPQ
jgi:hypothetical protein